MSPRRLKPWPRLRLAFLSACYRFSLGEAFIGDLSEDFALRVQDWGHGEASRWLWDQTVQSIPQFCRIYSQWGWAMMMDYFRTFYRNILRHKTTSLINLLGLSLGMGVFLLILLFIRNERQYDRFHVDQERIYRLVSGDPADKNSYAGTPAPMPEVLKANFPEIEDYVRIKDRSMVVQVGDRTFRELGGFYADSSFFSFFTFPLVVGNARTALCDPNAVVITETIARKYFGDEDAMGKTLQILGKGDFIVRGVAQDLTAPSHFHFDLVIPFVHVTNRYWGSWNYYTYIKTGHHFSPQVLREKVQTFFKGHEIEEQMSDVHYQSITDIHFQYNRSNLEPAINGQFLMIFQAVAFLVLLMACFNYVNLSTAYAHRRAREVGVKKALGLHRRSLMRQFLHEAVCLALVAELVALCLAAAFLPLMNQMAGRSLSIPWHDPVLWMGALGLLVMVGILAGAYPAFVLSAFNPVKVLKGDRLTQGRSRLRSVLVVLQFTISITLIVCTLFIARQMNYIQSRDLGLNAEGVVNIRLNQALRGRCNEIRDGFLDLASVQSASVHGYDPLDMNWHQGVYWEGQSEDDQTGMWVMSADPQFFETLEIPFIEGGDRVKHLIPPEGSRYFVINKAALDEIGWDRAEGKRFDFWVDEGLKGQILGVVENFNFRSLHYYMAPLVIWLMEDQGTFLSLRVQSRHLGQTLEAIRAQWQKLVPGFDMEYDFMDDRFAGLYRSEQSLSMLLNFFTGLSLFLAALGLFSLASFKAAQKTKEIGIRKVLGASIQSIAMALTRQFIRWVILANLFAWPLAYLWVKSWLAQFVYRIDLSATLFVVSGVAALVLAALTVGYQAVKASLANPVKSLKYE